MSLLAGIAGSAMAQRVMVDNFSCVKLHYGNPSVEVVSGDYLTLEAEGYLSGGELGAPALPIKSAMLTVPFCDAFEVTVENAVYDTVDLPAGRLYPRQMPVMKRGAELPFSIDEEIYNTDTFYARPLVTVTPLGVGRDRSYASISYSPVSVNPVSGKMVVCRSAEVTVRFVGSDAGATLKHYERYHTPAFDLGPTLNQLFTAPKDICVSAPVRMVVMAPVKLYCTAIDEFVDWKRRQGLLVDLIYVESGITADAIASSLRQMYDEATYDNPAPTYLLLVGDNNLMPTFPSDLSDDNFLHGDWYQLDNHVTDHYFTTLTVGDRLPDVYRGRFSARDTTTLGNIIDKTIYYERYNFSKDSYLGRAVLIAGVDRSTNYTNDYDNAWRCADPTMDYLAQFYFNADHGIDSLLYYKNNTNRVPDGVSVKGSSHAATTASYLRNAYNDGVGWVNYSAHGEWNEWYSPMLTVSQINNMSNVGRPSFMIGNCCLTNKFDEVTCFGEALLRRADRAGAVAYIGATNSSFWDQDFYWSVGIRTNIRNAMLLNYDANRLGMYDRLFHSHDEELSSWDVTAGRMVVAGNQSVQNASGLDSYGAGFAEYYWEIYELMGDPSLMPWLGTASTLTATVGLYDDRGLCVYSVPGAYVAFVTEGDHRLQASAFADADGMACFDIDRDSLSASFVSITAQGYKPYIKSFRSHPLGIDEVADAAVTVSPNPATDRCTVSADGLQRVMLVGVTGQTMCVAEASADSVTLDLQAVPAGFYLLRIQTADGACVKKLVVK